MTQAERCAEHIETALKELHRIEWKGHQTELNQAWDLLIQAKQKIQAIGNGKKDT